MWIRKGEHCGGGSSQHRFAAALALSLVAHGAALVWHLPQSEPNKFGAQTVTPRLQAFLANRAPAPSKVPVPDQLRSKVLEAATDRLVTPTESKLRIAPNGRSKQPAPRVLPPQLVETENRHQDHAPQPSPEILADRDAAIGEKDLETLRSTIHGQGRIRFRFTVSATGRVEDLIVETTEVPAEVELAVTRQLLTTEFLPTFRGGAAASSIFSLELEP